MDVVAVHLTVDQNQGTTCRIKSKQDSQRPPQ